MVGRANPQGSLLDPTQLFGHLVTKNSFYEKLARCGHELVTDGDFAQMYSKSRGRPSIPPSVMVRALLLAAKDQTSDREAARRSPVDLDWKAALGLDADHPGIGATTFSLMRARFVLHEADRKLLAKTSRKRLREACSHDRSSPSSTPPRCWGRAPSRTPPTCSEAPSTKS